MRGGVVALTSVLDLVGALLLIAGVAVFVAAWTIPGALVAAGALLLAFSWLLDRRAL